MKPIKRGGMYYAKWRCNKGYCADHPDGNVQHYVSLRSTARDEAQARIDLLEKKLDQQRYRIALGLPPDVVASDMTLEDFKERYLDDTKDLKAESTWQGEGYHLQALLKGLSPTLKLGELTPGKLELYQKARLRKVAPKTWNSHVATLQAVFEHGVKREWFSVNPLRALSKVKSADPIKDRYVAPSTILEAIEATPEPLWRYVMLFLYMTYCRGGELRRLKVTDVHRDRGFLEFVRPKERKPKRIALTPEILAVIDGAMELNEGSEYVFAEHGRQISKERLYRKVRKYGAGAVSGLVLGPHRFRHSGITDALESGVPIVAVQALAGHSQLSTTENYNHTQAETSRQALRPVPTSLIVSTHTVRR